MSDGWCQYIYIKREISGGAVQGEHRACKPGYKMFCGGVCVLVPMCVWPNIYGLKLMLTFVPGCAIMVVGLDS